jgi:hypothetical protein
MRAPPVLSPKAEQAMKQETVPNSLREGTTVQDSLSLGPQYDAARSDLLQQLHDLGHAGTTIVVNNRPMRLESAIKLVAQFPTVSYFTWSGARLEIEPNPFAPRREVGGASAGLELVRRLKQSRGRQSADRRTAWWQRLTRKLVRTARPGQYPKAIS